MRVRLCGVRGSTAAPGPEYARVGGHTSCVAIAHDEERPTLLLDAGTGIREVSALLDGAAFRGTILLGHLHWDHTQGLPFFAGGDREDAQVMLALPAQGMDPAELLGRALGPPHFPISPGGLRGDWRFVGLEAGCHVVEGFRVLALDIPHKGGRTFGFRIEDGRQALAYLSDHWPTALGPGQDGLGERHEAALRLAAGVDVLLHDAQYLAEELPTRGPFGHAAAEYAVALGEQAQARRVVLFHHDPARTDAEIDALMTRFERRRILVAPGRQGEEVLP